MKGNDMTYWKTTVSSLAIAALSAAAPLGAFAQSDSTDEEVTTEQSAETGAEVETDAQVDAGTETDANAEADASAEAEAEAEADTAAETEMEAEAEVEAETTAESGGEVEAETEAQDDAAMSESDTASDESMAEDVAAADAGAEEPKEVEGTILLQDENTVLAGDLIGSPVYNMENESIGDINDMIVTFDGQVQGVVIGVGGFLGIGEKDVAVELASLEIKETEGGTPRLHLDTTADDLKAAEAFVTAREQKQLEELRQSQEQTQDYIESGQNADTGATDQSN